MLDAIYIQSTPDTLEFEEMFRGLDANILVNPTYEQINNFLAWSSNRLLICGHGTEFGLFDPSMNDYCIDRSNVHLLSGREVIGIWCFAGNFADRYNLRGFFTSMFVSNVNEALNLGFTADAETISRENAFFSAQVRRLIEDNVPLSQWTGILQGNAHADIPFVRYNYEALAYYPEQ